MIYDLVWWCVPLFALPFWVITNASHEWSHGLAVLPWGWKFRTYILAHFFDTNDESTHHFWQKPGWLLDRPEGVLFYFARCDFIRTDTSKTITDAGWAWINIAPRLMNSLIIGLCFALIHVFNFSQRVDTALAVWAACNIVDAFVGFGVIFYWKRRDLADLWRFQTKTGWNLWFVRGLSLVCLGLMAGAFLWR